MKKYLAVMYGSEMSANGKKWMTLTPEKKQELEMKGMNAWMTWAKSHQNSIVEMGSPLGKTKRIDPKGITDTKNELTAWTVVQAESHDAAARMFLEHPHFSIFPGDSIEIMECLPIPGM